MRTCLAVACLLLVACRSGQSANPGPPGLEGTGSVRVTIEGFEDDEGPALVSLFVTKQGFPNDHEQAAFARREPVAGERVELVFDDVPAGPIAIATFHDRNDNGELDTDWLGRPTEPWGVSRDAKGWLGPPDFRDAVLDLAADQTLAVTVPLGS